MPEAIRAGDAMQLQDQSSREAIEGALAWWRDAGVDTCFSDDPRIWLEEPETDQAAEPEQPVVVAKEPPRRTAIERALEDNGGERIGGDPATWPDDLGKFREFWLTEPSLDDSGISGRIVSRGASGARLMVLVAQPEGTDTERLLSGDQGRLLAAIFSAMGLNEGEAYIASALPRHVRLPDWNDLAARGLGALTRHHIAVAKPQRLLVFGRGLAPLLTSEEGLPERLAIGERSVPVMVAPRLDRLARMPGIRKQFWTNWLEWSADA